MGILLINKIDIKININEGKILKFILNKFNPLISKTNGIKLIFPQLVRERPEKNYLSKNVRPVLILNLASRNATHTI